MTSVLPLPAFVGTFAPFLLGAVPLRPVLGRGAQKIPAPSGRGSRGGGFRKYRIDPIYFVTA